MSVKATARNKFQQLSGRVKEAFGRNTGNRRMQASGRMDRIKGSAKQVPERIKHSFR